MNFEILNNDITTLKVDALVNSTNYMMQGFSGVDSIIHELGGPEFEAECENLRNKLRLGEAVYTEAYGKLKCKYVIHTFGPRYRDGLSGEPMLVKSCYIESLKLADNLGCKSIAFPLICAGNMGYPIEDALGIAISAITEYLTFTGSKIKVTLAIYGVAAEQVAGKVLKGLDRLLKPKHDAEEVCSSLDEALAGKGEDFASVLMKFMQDRGLKDPDVYGPLLMHRQTFNKLVNGKVKNPKKETVLGIALVINLSYKETEKLLAAAGLAFSDASDSDIIIGYCIKHKIFNLNDVNLQLVKYNQKALFCE